MKHKLLLLYSWLVRTVLFFLPDVPFIMRFRGMLYGLGMKKCGKDFQVTHNAVIKDLQNIEVGDHCFVGNNSILLGSGKIILENEILIAPHVVLISGNHTSYKGSYRYGVGDVGIIRIERGAWIAANCTIQKNSTLPQNSVLSANSFLNKKFTESNSVYGGVPAKLIKTIKND